MLKTFGCFKAHVLCKVKHFRRQIVLTKANMKQGKRNNECHSVLLNVTHIWPKTNYLNLTNGITIFKKILFKANNFWMLRKFHSNHFHGRIKFNNFNEWTKYTTTNNGLTISTISLVKRKFLLFYRSKLQIKAHRIRHIGKTKFDYLEQYAILYKKNIQKENNVK